MKKFKLSLFLMFIIIALIGLVGCKKPPQDNPPGGNQGNNQGGNNQGGNNQGGNDEVDYDFMGANFIIMVDTVNTSDPRSSSYTALFQQEKVAAISKVESKYNLKVVYQAFPSDASWGGARERYIIQNSAAGTPKAHIYQIPSYSIGTLAVAKAISPLDEYISTYGAKGYWEESKAFGTALGHLYGYQDIYPTSDEGIFYNMDLLKEYLGDDKADLPSQLWLEGKWTWDAYYELCKQLDQKLPDEYFVMGGTAYNWIYQMLGANGTHVVDTDLKCLLDTQEALDTFTFVNNLQKTIRWDIDSCALSNATSTEMVKGKVAFHNGQSYWIYQSNKWLDKDFAIGYVPYPVGPNIKSDMTNYYVNDVYGTAQYVISSSYSKANVKPGYENSTLHDEIIFKIWSELQVFPEIDNRTGHISTDDYVDEYITQRIAKYYGSQSSIDCQMDVITRGYPDYFYSLDEAKAQAEGSYMLMIQSAIKNESDDIRATLANVKSLVQSAFMSKYGLDESYYG